jgi:hypothetical protein
VTGDSKQIQLSASDRGIVDYFFCFTCDEYVWDCDHLIDERLSAQRVPALEGSQLQSFAYDGGQRVLEIEFRVTPPFAYNDIPLPPPPRIIQYFDAPRYVLKKLLACKSWAAARAVLGRSHPNTFPLSDGADGVPTAASVAIH